MNNKMKKLLFLPIMALTVSIFIASCSKDEDNDNDVEPIINNPVVNDPDDEVKDAVYDSIQNEGLDYIKVPAEGGTYILHCRKAKSIYFTERYYVDANINQYGNYGIVDEKEKLNYNFDDKFTTSIENDSVIVVISPNTSNNVLKHNVGVQVDNEKKCFRFIQETSYKRNTKMIGDWILDPTTYTGLTDFENYRISLSEDGSYIRTINILDPSYEGDKYIELIYEPWENEHMYISLTHDFTTRYWCSPRIENGNIVLRNDFRDDFTFIPISKYDGPYCPFFNLYSIPTVSAFGNILWEGENYTIRCEIFAKGKNYKIKNMKLKRVIEKADDSIVTENVDINESINDNFEFAVNQVVPIDAATINYILTYDGTYTVKEKEIPFSYEKTLDISIKK